MSFSVLLHIRNVHHSLNMHTYLKSSMAKSLIFGQSPHLFPYFVNTSRKASGETAQMAGLSEP